MMRDAEAHADDDKKKRELIEARNTADSLIYSVEKSLKEYGDKITDDEKQKIQTALEKCRKAKDSSNDTSEIKTATEELTQASHKLAEHIYKDAQGQAAGAEGAGKAESKTKSPEEEVVEAEFEDVDKKKQ
jgi:molecular chaperone DnaK